MNVTITARHCELSGEERRFIEERVNGLLRYYSRIAEAQVTVIEEKYRRKAEIKVTIDHSVFFSEAESEDLKPSVEQVIQKLQRQLRRHKDRSRRPTVDKEDLAEIGRDATLPGGDEEFSLEPMGDVGVIEEMTLSEAVERVRTGSTSLLFRDSDSGRTKTVQRRGDGHIDIMETGSEDGD
jgi:putative sigma-54 modulation protein